MSTGVHKDWIDILKLNKDLENFFDVNKKEFGLFGSTVNQTFEAFVFASLAGWYRERGWKTTFVHPERDAGKSLHLKFSTRGRPGNYSYIRCELGGQSVQIRHQLRLSTTSHNEQLKFPANIVVDVAVIQDVDLTAFSTDDAVANKDIIAFGEAKHMSAFAELVASFLGMVHELQPERLKKRRFKKKGNERPLHAGHPASFLFVSGFLYKTARGINESIQQRGYDIDIYSRTEQMTKRINTSYKTAPKKTKIANNTEY